MKIVLCAQCGKAVLDCVCQHCGHHRDHPVHYDNVSALNNFRRNKRNLFGRRPLAQEITRDHQQV